MKRLIAAACALLCHVCANEVRMCDAISGRSPLCVITATMPCSKKLSDESIKTIFDVQHLLFEQHEEYMPGLLGDYNWQSVEIQNALDKVYREIDTLAIIRKTPKLIVFSENFFGRKIVRQKQEFETLLKQHTSRFEDTIFAINYLCTTECHLNKKDIKRTLSLFTKYYNNCMQLNYMIKLSDLLLFLKTLIPQFMHSALNYMQESCISKINDIACVIKATQIDFSAYNKEKILLEYINYLKHTLYSNVDNIMTLENITSYFWNGTQIMAYNKATYCNEVDCIKTDGKYYLYKFGIKRDIIKQTSKINNCILDNISTEICMDLFLGTKKHDRMKYIHVIQSDTINISKNMSAFLQVFLNRKCDRSTEK